jgi:hypothetical protein
MYPGKSFPEIACWKICFHLLPLSVARLLENLIQPVEQLLTHEAAILHDAVI